MKGREWDGEKIDKGRQRGGKRTIIHKAVYKLNEISTKMHQKWGTNSP